MTEWLSLIADVAGIVTAFFATLALWHWIVDKRRTQEIDGIEDALEAALDEHGKPFKEDRLFHLGPI